MPQELFKTNQSAQEFFEFQKTYAEEPRGTLIFTQEFILT